jgi:catechol 2,3-dioxygenase-like lactoylglutathione lyase family enzyme
MITGMPRIAIAARDFDACVGVFRDTLGMPVRDLSQGSVESLGAKLAMCVPEGGSNIELMSPANPRAPLSQSLQRFLDRRGEGLFALMLEAPDPDAEAEQLSARGLQVLPLMAGASGRDVHPNSTHGVLIRVYPVNSFRRPGDQDAPSKPEASTLSGIARVLVAVGDLDDAVTVYGDKLALKIAKPSIDGERGVRTAICTPPSGGVIELVSVAETARPFAKPIAEFLAGDREGMFALVLKARDLQAAGDALVARGLEVETSAGAPRCLEIEPTCTFGARIRIEALDPS